ncbi:hypothetical protein [Lysinibacillus sp. SGAir0095]|uniref:hypothetical protein n=1 Tax=Lysinibacillus sp. SGAir0095 TaxID=2070463 RepID=UPI0010CCD312|nr:hypothetical protein [Lysinibacillus sp. SGAir0095]QCR30955.1 hypothetical protein C1N55_01690 [Lysinibacillus sp. SGAir0095]
MDQKRTSTIKSKQQERQILSLINSIQSLQETRLDDDSSNEKHPLSKMLADALSDLVNQHKTEKEPNHETKNNNTSEISNSGNSDIDIKINIDLSSIAFAVLYSLFASKQLSKDELETALNRLEVLKQNE